MFKGLMFFMVAASALAGERLGEYSKFKMKYNGYTGEQTVNITEYKRSSDQYKVVTKFSIMGQSNEEVEMIPSDEIMTHDGASQTIAFCSLLSGTIESLNINGKSYQTCKVAVNDDSLESMNFALPKGLKGSGFLWLGDFPVNGVAKFKSTEMSLELKEFHWNN